MQRAGNILKKFIRDFGLEGGVALTVIKNQWVNIVGQIIATHTSPDIIRGKTIFITVDTPQWMHHLSFYKEEISRKLKSYNVNEVRFRLGKLPESFNARHKENNQTLTDEDSRYIENTLKSVKDEELKEKLRILLIHGLTKGRR